MNGEKARILIVDDDPFVREILEFVLNAEGYAVETAENGVEAMEKCIFGPELGLILSDLNMPEMGGLELTRELRNSEVDIPILVLTGGNEVQAALSAVRNGASSYLIKDEHIQETVLDAVERALREYGSRKAGLLPEKN